jgi:hypothetical protein
MAIPGGTRILAALVAVLLALGSSAGSARASENHTVPPSAPAPTGTPGHEHGTGGFPDMERTMAGGTVRDYSDGDRLAYRVKVEQKLQPTGPHPAGPQTGSLEMVLVESITIDGDGPLVTLEVTEASAEGFLAEAEEAAALQRRVQFRPSSSQVRLVMDSNSDGRPTLGNPETVKSFGDIGALRMVDMAIKAHLFNPVIPSDDYAAGDSFKDTGSLPAGWALGYHTLDGSISVEGPAVEDDRDVVRVKGVHIASANLLRVRAMDNAEGALQGLEEPEPNDFFAGTLFNALFPPGSTYESLMPPLPLQIPQPQARRTTRPGPRRRPRRSSGVLLGCLLLLGLAACSDPARNVDVVSLNMEGPMQMNHESVVDEATGVLMSSRVEASLRLTGRVYPIPPDMLPLLPEHLRVLSEAPIGMDAEWTITEDLESEVPEPTGFAAIAPQAMIAGGVVILGLALALFLRRRRSGADDETGTGSVTEPESKPEPADTTAPDESN